ncbi:hypothetical protein G6011_00323 [Alternaria panax]|uniref:Uncharacterized protein n=1 Tax=Alternaria panax TaxID=48097 RepID=A0AAD4NUW6_9PLEO|nr:hypothetical protein G6011_00323 [Alternaria panax]
MTVQCPKFSYTKPKRLPKRRIRPPIAAFRAAVDQLDFINDNAGRFRVPAIVELSSDEEISPEEEYRIVNRAAHKALGKQSHSASEDKIEHKKARKGKAKSETSSQQRRVVIDSDDDEDDGKPPHTTSHVRSVLPSTRNTKRPRDSFLSSADSANDETTRKSKRPRQDLDAELDDLDIDMEGWSTSEDAPKRLRRRK